MIPVFNNHWERTRTPAKPNSGKTKVETAGYIPADQQIKSLLDAGQRLVDYRRGYDFAAGQKDNGFIDPTRSPNYDMADASQDLRRSENKKKELVEASEKARIEKIEQDKIIAEKNKVDLEINDGS